MGPRVPTKRDITIAGMMVDLQYKVTKRGDRMAVFSLESMDGSIDCVMFPNTLKAMGDRLAEEAIVKVRGRFDPSDRGSQVLVSSVDRLAFGKQMDIELESGLVDPLTLNEINQTIAKYPGADNVSITLVDGGMVRRRIDLDVMVDTGNILLLSTLSSLLKDKGRVRV